ncbi:MAG: VanZ family protein [Lachnospiraceae bacterium]|nr:VanZ family protein [Lachnospiraceae bacterium]
MKNSKTAIKIILFLIYIVVLAYLLFAAESFGRDGGYAGVNLVPFAEIHRYLTNISKIGVTLVVINLLGNILLFVPFGYFLPSLFGAGKSRPVTYVLICMFFSIMIELLQFVTNAGCCDVDDVILNTLGGLCGYLCYEILHLKGRRR